MRRDRSKEKATARDSKILKRNSQRGGPSTPSPENQRQGECTKKEKRKGVGESQQDRWRDKAERTKGRRRKRRKKKKKKKKQRDEGIRRRRRENRMYKETKW